MNTTFHNTIGLTGSDLKEAVSKAGKQESAILLIFLHTRCRYTASDITRLTERAGKRWPLWSNRRAITNLKTLGELVMLTEKKIGPQGRPEHFYILNFNKYPSPAPKQAEIFL